MSATPAGKRPVIKGVRYFLAHTPGLVRYGFKPSLDVAKNPALAGDIQSHLRTYQDAVSYAPNRAYLGSIYPDDLRGIKRPWSQHNGAAERMQPHGDIMPEEEFYGLLKAADVFDLVWLEEGFVREARQALAKHPLIKPQDLEKLGEGYPYSTIEGHADGKQALPLYLKDGRLIGCVNRAHEDDPTLGADVLLENLACKAAAALALRTLLNEPQSDAGLVDYILNTGEEAVGDPYQRGGGNMAKAVGEMCGLENATGSDVKAFCCAPVHALVLAGSLVSSGVFNQVAVIGGCSLPKLGMNYQGHLSHDQPIIEDVLASVAIMVGEDDGLSPALRLDSVGSHRIGAGSSLRAISHTLLTDPLTRLGLRFGDIDKYAIELQNPEITEPAGTGNVTERNYRVIGALAVEQKEISSAEIPQFVEKHGMPGFSSTQGHIASAIPFLGHAVDRVKDGKMERAMFVAKGSLFLGRMTQMSDGFSFILECNTTR
jgi:hypothetical protein